MFMKNKTEKKQTVPKKPDVSKRGNVMIKTALYMAA